MHLIVPDNCTNCRFVYVPQEGQYFCRRMPPTANMIPGPHGPVTVGAFPPVSADTSCGEHKRKLVVAAA